MTLIFMDGFDDQTSGSFPGKWNSGTGTSYQAGRFGGSSLAPIGLTKIVPAASEHATWTLGTALYLTNSPSSPGTIISFMSDAGATVHITAQIDTNRNLTIKRATTTLITLPALIVQSWYYMEMKVTLHDTTGYIEFRINGSTMGTFTGDTRNAGTKAVFDSCLISNFANATLLFDDLYLCNGAGSDHNDFLGETRIVTLYPNADGDSSQFVGSDGNSASNYLLVDEPGAPLSTDYVESDVNGNMDLYNLTTLPDANVTIHGVQANNYTMKSDSGTRTAETVVKTGGTVYAGPTFTAGVGVYSAASAMWDKNPGTSAAWTPAQIDALQAGMRINS